MFNRNIIRNRPRNPQLIVYAQKSCQHPEDEPEWIVFIIALRITDLRFKTRPKSKSDSCEYFQKNIPADAAKVFMQLLIGSAGE